MKVAKPFFCTKSKKSYKAGDDYKGKRKDIPAEYFVEKKVETKN